jgi:mannose/cellobiose epimerase-like protein (N-acyl-D-glucosamine 2-epimerase family)
MKLDQMNSSKFKNKEKLKQHIFNILHFYYPKCIDYKYGGYINSFLKDGTIKDRATKHLVGTARFIYIFSIGAILDGPKCSLEAAEHGLKFLDKYHYDKENGGYFLKLDKHNIKDSSKQAYGHAFALLAASIAYEAGITRAKEMIEDIYETIEQHFWDSTHSLYIDEWNSTWTEASSYRGQNANMHMCEAMLTTYEATGKSKYLNKAYQLAKKVT